MSFFNFFTSLRNLVRLLHGHLDGCTYHGSAGSGALRSSINFVMDPFGSRIHKKYSLGLMCSLKQWEKNGNSPFFSPKNIKFWTLQTSTLTPAKCVYVRGICKCQCRPLVILEVENCVETQIKWGRSSSRQGHPIHLSWGRWVSNHLPLNSQSSFQLETVC